MVVEPTHAVERLRQKLQKHPSICLYWATGHHLVLQRVCERTVQAERHQVSILTNIRLVLLPHLGPRVDNSVCISMSIFF